MSSVQTHDRDLVAHIGKEIFEGIPHIYVHKEIKSPTPKSGSGESIWSHIANAIFLRAVHY